MRVSPPIAHDKIVQLVASLRIVAAQKREVNPLELRQVRQGRPEPIIRLTGRIVLDNIKNLQDALLGLRAVFGGSRSPRHAEWSQGLAYPDVYTGLIPFLHYKIGPLSFKMVCIVCKTSTDDLGLVAIVPSPKPSGWWLLVFQQESSVRALSFCQPDIGRFDPICVG